MQLDTVTEYACNKITEVEEKLNQLVEIIIEILSVSR